MLFIIGALSITMSVVALRSTNMELCKKVPAETTNQVAFKFNYDLLNLLKDHVGPEPFYRIDNRFVTAVNRQQLHTAYSLRDLLPTDVCTAIESFQGVTISLLDKGIELRETGFGEVLTPAQKQLVLRADYADNIRVEANYTDKNKADDHLNLVYYISITPEQQATYSKGHVVLMNYLKKNSEDEVLRLHPDQLQPGKVLFTVTKVGTVANAHIEESCGFKTLDKTMLQLIMAAPEKWNPAQNALGEPIEQELVFFFGREGC